MSICYIAILFLLISVNQDHSTSEAADSSLPFSQPSETPPLCPLPGQASSEADNPSSPFLQSSETPLSSLPVQPSSEAVNPSSPFLQSSETPRSSLPVQASSVQCCGFVLMTDNVDKNMRPTYQRESRQTESLHWCHSCAVKNRVDVSGLSDVPASGEITVESLLPTESDLSKLLADFEILVSR